MTRIATALFLTSMAAPAAADPGTRFLAWSEGVTPERIHSTERGGVADDLGLVLEDGLIGETRQPSYEPTAIGARGWLGGDPLELGTYVRSERSELAAAHVRTTATGAYAATALRPLAPWSVELGATAEAVRVFVGDSAASARLARHERIVNELDLAPGLSLVGGFAEAQSLALPDVLAAMSHAPLATSRTFEIGMRAETAPGVELALAAIGTRVSGETILGDDGGVEVLDANTRRGARISAGLEPLSWLSAAVSATFVRANEDSGAMARHVPELSLGGSLELDGSLGALGGTQVRAGAGLGARWLRAAKAAETPSAVLLDATGYAKLGALVVELELANLLDSGWAPGEATVAAEPVPLVDQPLAPRGFPIATPRTLMVEVGLEI